MTDKGIAVCSDPVRRCRFSAARAKSVPGQRGHQPVRIENGFVFEHEVNGSSQFDRDDRVGFELVAVHLLFQPLGQRSDPEVIAFGDDRSLTEGPAQIRITQLGPAQALDLAGAGHRAFDQPTVGEEIFDRGEARDVADFVEDGQAQVFTDPRHALQEGILATSDLFGLSLEFFFQGKDLLIEMANHGQVVFQGDLAQGIVFGRQQLFLPGIACAASLPGGQPVVGQLMRMDAGQQFGTAPDVEDALTQQRAQRPLVRRIDVGRWDQVGTQQVREFLGIDAVVFVFAAVNGFDVERMSQHEGEARGLASIGQPIPAKHAFAAHGEVMLVRLDELEEEPEVVVLDVGVDPFLALPIHDADVHLAGMQIDSAVELGGGGVILHN